MQTQSLQSKNHISENTTTTLVLDGSYQPIGFFTARSALHHLITGRGLAYDKYGNLQKWDEWKDTDHGDVNYPYLCTPNCVIMIPSIMIITHFFGNVNTVKISRRETSLRHLYKVYKGVCQYCLQKIPFGNATKDHVYPKSKGGLTSSCNLVLSCSNCNSKKANTFPYYDKNGNVVKPINLLPFHHNILYMPEMREEWKFFLYQK